MPFNYLFSITWIRTQDGQGEKLQTAFTIHPQTLGKHFLTLSALATSHSVPIVPIRIVIAVIVGLYPNC